MKPKAEETSSVKMRMEKSLRDKIHSEAEKTCRTWQDMIRYILKEYFKK